MGGARRTASVEIGATKEAMFTQHKAATVEMHQYKKFRANALSVTFVGWRGWRGDEVDEVDEFEWVEWVERIAMVEWVEWVEWVA